MDSKKTFHDRARSPVTRARGKRAPRLIERFCGAPPAAAYPGRWPSSRRARLRVLKPVARGLSNRQICKSLFLER
jgi:hypothetical protein